LNIYVCISSIFEQEFHGKKYFVMDFWKNYNEIDNYDQIVVDENKMVCKINYKQIASQENNYQYKYEITSMNINRLYK